MLVLLILIMIVQVIIYLTFNRLNKKFSLSKYEAVQKIHEGEVPRIGGLIFFIGFLIITFLYKIDLKLILPLLASCFFIFLISFYEDLRQSLSPIFRLLILFLGSFIFIFFTDLPEIKISFLSIIRDNKLISSLLFIFSFMLLMNGFNFIDGLNGLSFFNFYSILFNIYYLATTYNDFFLTNFIILIFAASIIVFLLNFPFGKVFLGDSGSYIFALISGGLTVYLFSRNSQLPTLFAMVILSYPITEMLFSILRKVIRGYSPLKPDTRHLHHLIFYKLKGDKFTKNNKASLTMLPICILPIFLSYFSINYSFDHNIIKFLLFFILYSLFYLSLNKIKN